MSDFTYTLPFTTNNFLKGIVREIKRKGETQLYYYIKDSKISIGELGISRYVDGSGRWNATGINIQFMVNPRYYDSLEKEPSYKSTIFSICNKFIPDNVGFDLKKIEFIEDLSIEVDDEDIINDLEEQINNSSKKILEKILPADIVEKGQEMAEAYTYLYSVENSLRIFIEIVAKENYGDEYFDKLTITSNLKRTIANRKENAANKKWLSFRGDNDLFYLDFKDLGTVINSNWDIFKEYFETQDFILPKISEMAECRNLIAHNSYIGKTERDLIKSYYNSIIMQISEKFSIDICE